MKLRSVGLLALLALLPVGASAQEARYLRCESPEALIDVVEVRESLEADPDLEVPVDLVMDYYLSYVPCEWTPADAPVDGFMETDRESVVMIWLLDEGPRYALREAVSR